MLSDNTDHSHPYLCNGADVDAGVGHGLGEGGAGAGAECHSLADDCDDGLVGLDGDAGDATVLL